MKCTFLNLKFPLYLHFIYVKKMNLPLGSNDKSVVVWSLGGDLNVDSELVKPCSALSHFCNNNSEVSGWEVIFIDDRS